MFKAVFCNNKIPVAYKYYIMSVHAVKHTTSKPPFGVTVLCTDHHARKGAEAIIINRLLGERLTIKSTIIAGSQFPRHIVHINPPSLFIPKITTSLDATRKSETPDLEI